MFSLRKRAKGSIIQPSRAGAARENDGAVAVKVPPSKWVVGCALMLLWLGGCGGGDKVDYKDLRDPDSSVRTDAALRLGQAKSVEAVGSLLAVLDDPDEAVRVTVVRSLGQIGDSRAVPALVEALEDPLRSVRMAACQSLGQIGDAEALSGLSEMLYTEDDNLRLCATSSIGRIDGAESLDLLLTMALRDDNDSVRELAIKLVKYRGAREAIPQLEEALAVEADDVRANAAEALGVLGDRSSVPVLIAALDDPFHKVRSLSAHSLFALAPDDDNVLQAIQARAEIEDNQMSRVDLAWNLARLGDVQGLEVLRLYLFRGDPEDVRAEAAMALGEVGDESDIPLLQRAASDKKGLVREQALWAIEKLKKAA